jgi:hypothetical protein
MAVGKTLMARTHALDKILAEQRKRTDESLVDTLLQEDSLRRRRAEPQVYDYGRTLLTAEQRKEQEDAQARRRIEPDPGEHQAQQGRPRPSGEPVQERRQRQQGRRRKAL